MKLFCSKKMRLLQSVHDLLPWCRYVDSIVPFCNRVINNINMGLKARSFIT